MNTILSSAITNIGQRSNNEDNFLEIPGKNIFLVCDGVGGAAKGEVASKLCCDSFQHYFEQNNVNFPDQRDIQKALLYTESCLTDYIQKNETSEGMATTLTLLSIRNEEAHIAHAGDSRVYHIRDGGILFVTVDHSLVAEMVASGFITPEEALTHPKKNLVRRAVQGNGNPTDVEYTAIQDVRSGDYFLLCTDGVLESVGEDFISGIFKAPNTVEQIGVQIEEACLQNSRDNFTAIVIQVTQPNLPDAIESLSPVEISKELKNKNEGDFVSAKTLARKRKKFLFILLVITLLGSVSFFYFAFKKNSIPVKKSKTEDSTVRQDRKVKIKNDTNQIRSDYNSKPLDSGTVNVDSSIDGPSSNISKNLKKVMAKGIDSSTVRRKKTYRNVDSKNN